MEINQKLKDNNDNIEKSFDKSYNHNYFKTLSFIYQPQNIFPVQNFIPINNQTFNFKYPQNENLYLNQSLNNVSHKENNIVNNSLFFDKYSKHLFDEYKKYNQGFIDYNSLNVNNENKNKIYENNLNTLLNFYPLNSNANSLNNIPKI